jgi:vacuolar protein sorting-associated protein 18
MSECDQTCSSLREEIKRLRNYNMTLKSDARCALTNQVVLTSGEPFYVFPSGYVFVASALKKEVMPFLNQKQKSRVDELERQLKTIHSKKSTNAEDERQIKTLQTELDGLIAAECPLTGSILVNSIDQGFEGSHEVDDLVFLGLSHNADSERNLKI